ncbi:hypothetical protein NFI96_007336, partial [Prochilodus magdalenae]
MHQQAVHEEKQEAAGLLRHCCAARRYCPHHVGHYLGMDVHDTPELSRSQPLQPGMAITIEP